MKTIDLKKLVGVLIGIILLGSSSMLTASAELPTDSEQFNIQNAAISMTSNELVLNPNGSLTCLGQTSVLPKYTASITLELQKFNNGSWITIQKWSSKNYIAAKLKEIKSVEKGYSYRLQTTHCSYSKNGKLLDVVIKSSNIVKP